MRYTGPVLRAIGAAIALTAATAAGASPVGHAVEMHFDAPRSDALARPIPVADRPAMSSFQPYFNLQFGFRPQPPAQYGARSDRPQVIMPKPVAPLIEFGSVPRYPSLGYAYCADPPGDIEPRTGPYEGSPRGSGSCP